MATRENQGLFIAVILLVLLSVVLAVATFFGYSGLQEAKDQSNSYKDQLAAAQQNSDAYAAQAGILKAMIGVSDVAVNEIPTYKNQLGASGKQDLATEMNTIQEAYEADMAKVQAGEEGTDQTYRGTVDQLTVANAQIHNAQTVLNTTVVETVQKMETEISKKDKQLIEKESQLEKARNDLIAEQQRHSLTRDEYKTRLDEAELAYKKIEVVRDELSTKLVTAKTAYNNDIEKLASANLTKEARINELTALETNIADGRIVSVAPVLGKVTINLGSDDELRLKQTFAVYDKSASLFKSGHGKAMLEVIKILEPHMAEARILSQSTINPILTEDHIVTSTWDPGYSVPVAIVGKIDLDGDGESDLERLISIVENQGNGTVVAHHDEEGNVFGEIDEATRFFVIGDGTLTHKGRDGFNRLDAQRQKYQTRKISVQEFLKEIGWQSEAKIQHFEENIPSGFQPRQPGTKIEEGNAFEDGN